MVFCNRCGSENPEDAVYCSQCGVRLEQKVHHEYREEADYLGAVSVGVIFIVVAITYFCYPFDFSIVFTYFGRMIAQQRYIKPPLTLFSPAVFFFRAAGVWYFILSAIRVVLQKSYGRAVRDFARGLFSFYVAFLLTEYSTNQFAGWTIMIYFVVGVGALTIVDVFMRRKGRDGDRAARATVSMISMAYVSDCKRRVMSSIKTCTL